MSDVQHPKNFEISFYERLLEDKPDHIDALMVLAECYTTQGQYEKGLELDLRLSNLCPDDGVVHYNLACSYALTNQVDKAIHTLGYAVDLGYSDLDHLRKDPDLKNLYEDRRFKELMEKWGLPL